MPKQGYLYALGAAVAWGLTYTISQRLLETISAARLMLLGSVVALMLSALLVLREGSVTSWRLDAMTWRWFALMEVSAFIANYLGYLAVSHIGASRASFFEIAYPFFIVLFSIAIFKERPTLAVLVGGFLIFSGVFVILTEQVADEPPPPESPNG